MSAVLATSTITFAPPIAYAASVDLPEMATRIAIEHGISPVALKNLANSESTWNPKSRGDFNAKKGSYCSYGLTQINICAHPEVTKEQALDPEWNLEWAAEVIESGKGYIYTSGNCYSLVSTKIPNLPRMAAIQPNSPPVPGAVAIFYYRDRQTGKVEKHVAYTKAVKDGAVVIQEANKEPFLIDTRTVSLSDPHLAGFWNN